MQTVTVFCGSNAGADPVYAAAARALAATLTRRGLRLVYGGGGVGLMGILADAMVAAGGAVTGVIPRDLLAREVGHRGLADLRVVADMHERKALMASLGDAFVALPGGYGTLEELFEAVTWAQLGIHRKPCGLLDVAGFYAPLGAFLDHAVEARFISRAHRALVLTDRDPGHLLDRLAAAPPVDLAKWEAR